MKWIIAREPVMSSNGMTRYEQREYRTRTGGWTRVYQEAGRFTTAERREVFAEVQAKTTPDVQVFYYKTR